MESATNGTQVDAATDLTAINILTYVFLCVVTFGIGSAVDLSHLRTVLRKRKAAFCVGLLAQYLAMPAVARLVASTVLSMPDVDAFAVILIGCCPGGATSNAFAYFARADMALSVSMTAVSNALAFGMLPLLLFLWTQGMVLPNGQTSMPYLDIFGSLCMVLIPAGIGVTLRHRQPQWAKRAEKVGAVGGVLLIVSSIFAGLIQNGSSIGDAELLPWRNAVAVILIAPIGMVFALLAAVSLNAIVAEKLPLASVATVVIETGVQNTVLALAICTLTTSSWPAAAAFRMQLIPILWGIFVSTEACVVMLLFRWRIGKDESQQLELAAGGAELAGGV